MRPQPSSDGAEYQGLDHPGRRLRQRRQNQHELEDGRLRRRQWEAAAAHKDGARDAPVSQSCDICSYHVHIMQLSYHMFILIKQLQSILDVLSGRSTYDSGVITLDGEIVTERGE